MIVANVALARSVNYDHKVSCRLKHTFTIVNYDPKPFIVQATGLMRLGKARAYLSGEPLRYSLWVKLLSPIL